MSMSSTTSYTPTAISPFSSRNSLLSEPTSDDQPDLGAFRTVFRALTDLHQLPTGFSRRQISIESTNSSHTFESSNTDDSSSAPTNPWSTVWTHGPLSSYLHPQRLDHDMTSDMDADLTSDDNQTNPTGTTNPRSPDSHTSSLPESTSHFPPGPPTSIDDSETQLQTEYPEESVICGGEGEEGEIGDAVDEDDVQLSLGYLNETLSFIAAERVRLAALRETQSSTANSKASSLAGNGALTGTSSTSESEPRLGRSGKRRRKWNGSTQRHRHSSSVIILQRHPLRAPPALTNQNEVTTAVSLSDQDHSAFEGDDSSSSADPSGSLAPHPSNTSKSTKSTKSRSSASSSTNRRLKRTRSTPLLKNPVPPVKQPPSTVRGPVDPRITRLRSLASKLRVHFPADAQYLRRLMRSDYIRDDDFIDPRGPSPAPDDRSAPIVHTFIDHSNILVGLITYIKKHSHLLPDPSQRRGKISLSHSALSLILERGRPVTRRVLVASSPLYQPMESAIQLGYEVRIYARVPQEDATSALGNAGANNSTSRIGGGSSGDVTPRKGGAVRGHGHLRKGSTGSIIAVESSTSASDTPSRPSQVPTPSKRLSQQQFQYTAQQVQQQATSNTPPRVRYREQGVDELLQLKIHDALSQFDSRPPLGSTIVLATGDGNAGQFSEEGFIGPIRVALRKGWNVELYSWEEGLSRAWKREFEDWGEERFRIIGMERFASDLVEV